MKAIALTAAILFSVSTVSLFQPAAQPEANPTATRANVSSTEYTELNGMDDPSVIQRQLNRELNPLQGFEFSSTSVA